MMYQHIHSRVQLRTRLHGKGNPWAEVPEWAWALEQILLAPERSTAVN